jgi:purine-binding chemotaxis protein CheW
MSVLTSRPWCTFRVGDACFAVDSAMVIEVLRDRGLTPVPLAAPGVLGLAHLRGRIVPVVDPAERLGSNRRTSLARPHLVVALGDDWYGLLVDEMLDVIEIPPARVERPTAPGGFGDAVTGTFAAENRLVHLLDPERMIHSLVRQAAHQAGRLGGTHGGDE